MFLVILKQKYFFFKEMTLISLIIFGTFLNASPKEGNEILGNGHFKLIQNNKGEIFFFSSDGPGSKFRYLFMAKNFLTMNAGNKNIDDFSAKIIHKNNNKTVSMVFTDKTNGIEVIADFSISPNHSNALMCFSSIKNRSGNPISIASYSLGQFVIDAKNFGSDSSYTFWSFQGGSYPDRPDWIFPLSKNYFRKNYQGMNAEDYGGGMPFVDLWSRQQGVAIASLSLTPELISLPVTVQKNESVSLAFLSEEAFVLKPQEKKNLIPFALIFHRGDFYNALLVYSSLLQTEGMPFPSSPKAAFASEWCAWGYQRNFTQEQILSALPKVKELGLGWVTLDDGWQNANGDWNVDLKKFPGGEKEFAALIDSIHSYGLKVRLWFTPFDAHDAAYNKKFFSERANEFGMNLRSRVADEHPDWFLQTATGSRSQVSWWNSFLLCPAVPEVQKYYKDFITKAIVEWKIDGFKIDGQHLNAVPNCFNPAHKHQALKESFQSVPVFFKELQTVAKKLNSEIVMQLCPCGTNYNLYNLPYINQVVGSDPVTSFQVRLKGKTFKAIYGKNLAYSGDHVELTNRKWNSEQKKFLANEWEDFASTLAVGGVPATKFTSPYIAQDDSSLMLTPQKELYWKKWLSIYNKEKMSGGEYLNLYDIAFDKPETHLIKKGNEFYYSFFSETAFTGTIIFRGLLKGKYSVENLVNGEKLAEVSSKHPSMQITFQTSLLLKLEKI